MRSFRTARGFSLIEMMIVMLIIAFAMGVVMLGFGATAQAKLRSSAWKVVAGARYAYSRAVTSGTTTRLVIDFEKRTLQIQETTGRVVLNTEDESGTGLRRGDDEEYLSDAGIENASLSTKLDAIGQSIGGIGQSFGGSGDATGGAMGSPLEMLSGGAGGADPFGGMMADIGAGAFSDPFLASMQGGGVGGPSRYRGARFQPLPGSRGEARDLEGDSIFLRVYTPHENTPREDGKAYVYFFPGGVTEHAVIQLSDGDERVYSVEIHPLSGRSIVHTFEFEPEDDLDQLMEDEE